MVQGGSCWLTSAAPLQAAAAQRRWLVVMETLPAPRAAIQKETCGPAGGGSDGLEGRANLSIGLSVEAAAS